MKDTSCPAFPNIFVDKGNGPEDPGPYGMSGLSIRDYFAGQALVGWLASFAGVDSKIKPEDIARESYQFADAMLAERNQGLAAQRGEEVGDEVR